MRISRQQQEQAQTEFVQQFGILDLAKQRHIWNAEHITFEIETHIGQPFTKALREKNAPALTRIFHDDFTGQIRRKATWNSRQCSLVTEQHLANSGFSSRLVNTANGIVKYLLKSVNPFQQIQRCKLRVLQIDQSDNDSATWKVKILLVVHGRDLDGKWVDWKSEHQWRLQCANDQKIAGEKIISRWNVLNETLRTCPRPLMEEATKSFGLADLSLRDNWDDSTDLLAYRQQLAVEDFDRDGYLDIAVATFHRVLLLQSVNGQRFKEVGNKLLQPRQPYFPASHLASWVDFDNDGFPDLVLRNRLFHNVNGKQFIDITELSGLRFKALPYGCIPIDYNADGLLDLYVIYQVGPQQAAKRQEPWVGDNRSGMENQLWRNLGEGRFEDVTLESGTGGGPRHSFAAAWLFFDDDHFPDVYIANDFAPNVLLRNRGDGTFADISRENGATDFATSMGAVSGDLDNNGSAEIYVANMYSKMGRRIIAHVGPEDYPPGIYHQIIGSCAGSRLYRMRDDAQGYEEISEGMGVNEVGWAHGAAMVDLDSDGWLDLYATAGYMSFDQHKPDG